MATDSGLVHAHLEITLGLSSSTVSLSQTDPARPFQLITRARVLSTTQDHSAVTICTDGSPLDNGQHKHHGGLFRGVFLPFESLSDPSRRIQIGFAGCPNYGSLPDIPNLKERPWTRFETVPSQGQGSLIVKHDLYLDRMFQNSRDLHPGDIKPGEKFRVRLNPKRLDFISWWTFGNLNGNLKEKKFAKWQLPDKTGLLDDLMPGEKEPDVNRMLNEGWVFSQRRDELKVTESAENDNVIFEFIE